MRQGRGVLAGFRVDSCAAVVTAAAATNTMLHRAASYMYTYLSLNQKKSDPRFIMPIIFLRTNLNLLRRLFGNTNLKRLTAKTVVVWKVPKSQLNTYSKIIIGMMSMRSEFFFQIRFFLYLILHTYLTGPANCFCLTLQNGLQPQIRDRLERSWGCQEPLPPRRRLRCLPMVDLSLMSQ